MSIPRVLVVRSGANPFLRFASSSKIAIVEKISHSIEFVSPSPSAIPSSCDLAIFTSQVAVERAFGDLSLSGPIGAALEGARVIAVGTVTAEVLESRGVRVALIAKGSADSVLEHLPSDLRGQRILLPCGEDAAPDLPERLRARGASVTRLVLYRKIRKPFDPSLEREILEHPFAAFCATSPSAGSWLFAGVGEEAARRLRETPAVVLGRFTRRLLESQGVRRIEITPEARFSEAVSVLEHLAEEPVGT